MYPLKNVSTLQPWFENSWFSKGNGLKGLIFKPFKLFSRGPEPFSRGPASPKAGIVKTTPGFGKPIGGFVRPKAGLGQRPAAEGFEGFENQTLQPHSL